MFERVVGADLVPVDVGKNVVCAGQRPDQEG
jgi:hypothetical protein